MPIYEYECRKCGEFEVTQRITEDPLERCPTCRRKVKKLISQSSFHLKGSGWYVTDYARKENGGRTAETSTPKESSTSKSESASNGGNGGNGSNGSHGGNESGADKKESKADKTTSKKETASATT